MVRNRIQRWSAYEDIFFIQTKARGRDYFYWNSRTDQRA